MFPVYRFINSLPLEGIPPTKVYVWEGVGPSEQTRQPILDALGIVLNCSPPDFILGTMRQQEGQPYITFFTFQKDGNSSPIYTVKNGVQIPTQADRQTIALVAEELQRFRAAEDKLDQFMRCGYHTGHKPIPSHPLIITRQIP